MARILLVDDDNSSLNLYKNYLSDEEHEVLSATNYFEALDFLYEFNVDLAVVDLNMPYRNGFDLIERIRRSPRFKNMPVSVLSARSEKQDILKAKKLGADRYLVKPVSRLSFKKEIHRLMPSQLPSERTRFHIKNPIEYGGKLTVHFQVLSLSEYGVSILCSIQPTVGQFIQASSPLFKEIGLQPSPLKVVSTTKVDQGKWKIGLQFTQLSSEARKLLRDQIIIMNENSELPSQTSA